MKNINIYCDESNHLENDDSDIMTIGAVYAESDHVKHINKDIRNIKIQNNIPLTDELKWTKISDGRLQAYIDLINYFFDNENLFSRTILIANKKGLNHSYYNQTHDEWYYKMHYGLVEHIIQPNTAHNIYLDYKDTNMYYRGQRLHDVLNRKLWKHENVIINKVQPIRSHEVEIMQIVDVLIGAIAYKNKGLRSSANKLKIIDLIENRSNENLFYESYLREKKLNRFIWNAAGDSRDL